VNKKMAEEPVDIKQPRPRKGTKTAPPQAASVSQPVAKLSTKEERGMQAGELAKKASKAKRRKASMPNSAVQARDEIARNVVGSIARKVELSFITTTAPQADESLTICLSLLDRVHANNSPSGVGLRPKPRFTQLCAPHNFECSKAVASVYSETHEIFIVHTATEFTALMSRSGPGPAPQPIQYTKNTITAGHQNFLKVSDSTPKKQLVHTAAEFTALMSGSESPLHPNHHTKDNITAGNKHIINVPDSTRKKQRGFKRPRWRHQPPAETHDLCALSRVGH